VPSLERLFDMMRELDVIEVCCSLLYPWSNGICRRARDPILQRVGCNGALYGKLKLLPSVQLIHKEVQRISISALFFPKIGFFG
ncbi:MAG: hypothetical protein ACPG4J_09505, partial [Lentibacter algarum]